MSPLLQLICEFFKIGLFSIGGGLATLPFLYELAEKTDWISVADIGDIIAVSESTPGALGINMATYVGFFHSGLIGGVLATLGLVLPSFIIVVILSQMLQKFQDNQRVQDVFYFLRPAVTGLILAAGIGVGQTVFRFGKNDPLPYKELLLFFMLYYVVQKHKVHPVIMVLIGGIVGILFKFN